MDGAGRIHVLFRGNKGKTADGRFALALVGQAVERANIAIEPAGGRNFGSRGQAGRDLGHVWQLEFRFQS